MINPVSFVKSDNFDGNADEVINPVSFIKSLNSFGINASNSPFV